jgi:hypothetical protein
VRLRDAEEQLQSWRLVEEPVPAKGHEVSCGVKPGGPQPISGGLEEARALRHGVTRAVERNDLVIPEIPPHAGRGPQRVKLFGIGRGQRP